MVLIHAVNRFQLAMTAREGIEALFYSVYDFLQGRGAGLFLVLAGVGLSLQAGRRTFPELRREMLRRGLFLFAAGMVHRLFNAGDILHIIGLATLLAIPLLRLKSSWLVGIAAGLALAVPIICGSADFYASWAIKDVLVQSGYGDIGMNSVTITYRNDVFWTLKGFFDHTVWNGLYPLIPKFGLVLVGISLGRLDLGNRKTLQRLGAASGLVFAGTMVFNSLAVSPWLKVAILPHTPMYIVSAAASACMVIAICQLSTQFWGQALAKVGRLAFTAYISHVVVFAVMVTGLRWIWPGSYLNYPFWVPVAATGVYMALILGFGSWYFSSYAKGPLEYLMRIAVKGKYERNTLRPDRADIAGDNHA